jgi:hypothetical protein
MNIYLLNQGTIPLVIDRSETKKGSYNGVAITGPDQQQHDLLIDLLRQAIGMVLLNQKELKQINQNLQTLISKTNGNQY